MLCDWTAFSDMQDDIVTDCKSVVWVLFCFEVGWVVCSFVDFHLLPVAGLKSLRCKKSVNNFQDKLPDRFPPA